MQESDSEMREFLISSAFQFIERVISMPGIRRIAIIGSLTSTKPDPKDIDMLLTIEDDVDLTELASASRKLMGAAQTGNKGADIFLANPAGEYIGRICQWRSCAPGIRIKCDADHCGKRHFLHDDFGDIKLKPSLVMEPPVEVWPKVVCREKIASDLLEHISRFQSNRDKL